MARGDFVDRLARRYHQHLYRRHAERAGRGAVGQQMTELIQTLQQLDVAFQAVNERAVEHVPADLRQGRLLAGVGPLQRLLRVDAAGVAADTHHQDAAGAQVQGRADRCRLAYRAIAEIFFADFHRGKEQGNGGTRQQMFDRQLSRHADSSMAQPGVDGAAALIKGHCLAGLVTERGHRHCLQLLLRDGFVNPGHVQFVVKQPAQRRTVEQGHWNLCADAHQVVTDKTAGLMDHPGPVAAQYQVTAKALPERGKRFDGAAKIHRPTGQADRVDRPGRRADDHWKRIACPHRQQFGNRCQHTDLIGRPGPATGKNQACDRFNRTHGNTPGCWIGLSLLQPCLIQYL
ncbi:hypothetical protein D3C87_1295670 [compost metagenome]